MTLPLPLNLKSLLARAIPSLLIPGMLIGATFDLDPSTRVEVDAAAKIITVSNKEQLVLQLQGIQFDYTDPQTLEVLNSDEGSVTLQLTYSSVVDYWHHADDTTPRIAEVTIEAVEGGIRLHGNPKWAEHVTLLLKDTGDHQFGLSEPLQPDNHLSPDLRGSTIDVEVKSDGETFVENYASAFSAFYMSSAGYGAFFDTFARGRYQFAGTKGTHRIHHDTGTLDWYVFFGNNGTSILAHYYRIIGAPKSIPIWAVGPVLWRDDNKGCAAEILDDAQRFDDLRIPATTWFVDRPYSDGSHRWSKMNFGKGFENPDVWISKLRADHGVEFLTWTATAFFGDPRFGHHLDDWHTYMDLSDSVAVEAFKAELKKNQYAHGVKGHKMDRADEQFSAYAPWADKTVREPSRRNQYVYLFAKVHHDALTDAWGEDQFNFARSAYHRVQPYLSAIWGGDPRSSWDGFRGNFANAIRASFIGFPIWGSDVGGYLGDGDIPEDLYVRWLQAGSMSGLFEIKLDGSGGKGADRVPWHYPESLQNIFRKVCEERMQMLPTLYSLANTSATHGVLMQPMAYADLSDAETYDIWDQFYLGDAILVAPVFTQDTHRQVYLPKGRWFDFDDPTVQYSGGKTLTVQAPLEKFPRFVRANSLYLTGNIYRGSDRNWKPDTTDLTLHLFPGNPGDTYSFDYVDPSEPGEVKAITLQSEADRLTLQIPELRHLTRIEWVPAAPVKAVLWNGAPLAITSVAAPVAQKLSVIELPQAPGSGTLMIEY